MELTDSQSGVSLRKFKLEDRDRLIQLADNPSIAQNLRDGFPNPYLESHADKFISDALSSEPTTRFCIEKEGVYVGNIGLHPFDDIYRKNAEIGYFIGEPYWGQGIASTAVKLMTRYGFEVLGYHRIQAGVFSYNLASKKVLEKAGYEYEGAAKQAVFKNGEFFDELKYGILNPSENLTP